MIVKTLRLIPLVVALAVGCQKPPPPVAQPITQPGTAAVTFEIIVGENTDSFQIEHVATGTTLESLMRSIDNVPITIQGSGITAFVDGIGDTSTSSGEGWTFQVDGEFSTQGIGSTTLTPPTTITWSYGDASEFVPK